MGSLPTHNHSHTLYTAGCYVKLHAFLRPNGLACHTAQFL